MRSYHAWSLLIQVTQLLQMANSTFYTTVMVSYFYFATGIIILTCTDLVAKQLPLQPDHLYPGSKLYEQLILSICKIMISFIT